LHALDSNQLGPDHAASKDNHGHIVTVPGERGLLRFGFAGGISPRMMYRDGTSLVDVAQGLAVLQHRIRTDVHKTLDARGRGGGDDGGSAMGVVFMSDPAGTKVKVSGRMNKFVRPDHEG
jgi:hypothetical protein